MYSLLYYHYTSQDAAMNILQSKKIRFTNVDDSEDYYERIEIKKNNLIRELKNFHKDICLGKYDDKEFRQNRFNNHFFVNALELLINNYKVLENIDFELYQFCLTKSVNSLNHWKCFSNNGRGVCIEFDYEKIFNSMLSNAHNPKLSFMDYQQAYDARTIREEIYCFVTDLFERQINIEEKIYEVFKELLYIYCVHKKRNKYRKEKEIKLIYVIDKKTILSKDFNEGYYFKDGNKIRYLEVYFEELFEYITSIYLGYDYNDGCKSFDYYFPNLNIKKTGLKITIKRGGKNA